MYLKRKKQEIIIKKINFRIWNINNVVLFQLLDLEIEKKGLVYASSYKSPYTNFSITSCSGSRPSLSQRTIYLPIDFDKEKKLIGCSSLESEENAVFYINQVVLTLRKYFNKQKETTQEKEYCFEAIKESEL